MKRSIWLVSWILCSLLIALSASLPVWRVGAGPAAQLIQAPQLKWQRGGCTSWCETGWYSSPAVADLDNDGTIEVLAAAYSVWALNGEDGSVQWSIDPPGGRVWPGVVVADVDGDDDWEVVTAHGDGYVHIFDHLGNIDWSKRPISGAELRGLAVYGLDGDGMLDVIVNGAWGSKLNTWIYDHDGKARSGWPQLAGDSGYAAGVYNDNAAVADLDGDSVAEIVVPSDVHYICAYEENGAQIPAHPMYGSKGWGLVGVWESLDVELRGWGYCYGEREERYRTNFAHGAAVIADVNGDGLAEVVVTGNVYDCDVGHPPGKYNGVYVFNADRSRFNQDGYDWRSAPVDTGAPLTEDYGVIENNQPNPVVVDLDGDGRQEILYASYDGRVHAFWLDGTEHHSWPYAVYDAGEGFYRLASEPVIADLNDDGYAEIIVSSWTQKTSGATGKLHILDYRGIRLREVDLPAPVGSSWKWNGALAAPTLANIDADADLEVVLNTAHSGVVAYDLPNTPNARILWDTGRANYQRTGSLLYGNLQNSDKSMWPLLPGSGEAVTTRIVLRNSGAILSGVQVTDLLASELHYQGDLTASSGQYGENGGVITWLGTVAPGVPVTITFGATVDEQITGPQHISNTALIDDGAGSVLQRRAAVVANGYGTYVPVALKDYTGSSSAP